MKDFEVDTSNWNFASPRSLQSFSSHRHESLVRCKVCRFKYDIAECYKIAPGYFVCLLCFKQNGDINV